MKYLIGLGLIIYGFAGFAQQRPFINNLDNISGAPGEKVVISGSGFNPGNMQVNFGAGIATITNSTTTSLEVTVPATATYGPVSALDLNTGLAGVSTQMFTPRFYGNTFDETAVDDQVDFATDMQYTYDVCSCDLDGDGLIDVAAANNNDNNVSIFRNTSTLTTTDFVRTNIPNNFETISAECGDLNGDGKPDLVFTTNDGSNAAHVFVYRNTSTVGNISFARTEFLLPTSGSENRIPKKFEIADIDGDGLNDLAMGNQFDNVILIYRNTSATGAAISFATPDELTVTGAANTGTLKAGDLNGDGLLDLVTLAPTVGTQSVFVFRNESSSGSIKLSQQPTVGSEGNRINLVIADLDGDQKKDIATTSSVADEIEIFLNTTSSSNAITFSDGSTTVAAENPWGMEAADVDGDGQVDLNIASTASAIHVLENASTPGTLNFTAKSIATDLGNRNITLFDVNGDAKPDFVTANNSERTTDGNMTVVINRNCLEPVIGPPDLTFCRDNPFTISTIKTLGTSYNWEVTAGTATLGTNGNDNISVTVTSGNSANIRVTITSDDGSCTDVATQTFTLTGGTPPDAPSISNSNTGTICAGESFTLTAPTGEDEYLWTLPDGTETTLTTNTLQITNASSSDAGEYQLRVRQSGSCFSELGTEVVSVDEPPVVSVANNGVDNFCANSSVVLEVPDYDGFTYQWKRDNADITGETNTTLTASTSGDYTVAIVSDASECTNISEPYSLTAVTLPVSSFDAVSDICVDISTDFSSTSTGMDGFDLEYAWDFGDGATDTGADVSHAFTTAGSFDVTLTTSYTDVATCQSSSTQTITTTTPPTNAEILAAVTPGADERLKCPNDTLTLTLQTSFETYTWKLSGDTISETNTAPAYTAADQNTVELELDITTDIGCTTTGTLVEVANFDNSRIGIASDEATITNDTINLADGASTVALRGTNGRGYEWEPVQLLDNATGEAVTVYPKDRFTTVTVSGEDEVNGCQTTASVVIETPGVIPRKSFSPNGDGLGFDCWEILNTENLEGCTVYVFDQRGTYVFQGDSPFDDNCVWNGNVDNGSTQAPEGIYYFVMKCDNSRFDNTGSILLAR